MLRYAPPLFVRAATLVALALSPACSSDTDASPAADAGADSTALDEVSPDVALAPDAPGDVDEAAADVADLQVEDTAPVPPYLTGKVDEPGPYNVGFRTVTVTYTPTAATDGEPLVLPERTLRVAIWYPAQLPLGDVATYTLGISRPNLHVDAPVLEGGPLPVLLYSHGHPGFAEVSYFLTEHFASHGFLVMAPDHTGDTLVDSPTRTNDSYLVRPLDLSALLDWLKALPAEDPLHGRASDAVVVAGHSYGGYTAFAVGGGRWDVDAVAKRCADGWDSPFCTGFDALHQAVYRHGLGDPRVDLLLPMAAGDAFAFTPGGLAELAAPTLLITGGRDLASADPMSGDLYWEALPASPTALRLAIPDAAHLTFTDTCEALGGITEGDGCDGPPYIAPDEAHRIINSYALAFVRARLFNDTKGQELLDGRVLVAPPAVATLRAH